MTAILQKMTAAAFLPSAIFAEVSAHAFSLAAGNVRSLLADDPVEEEAPDGAHAHADPLAGSENRVGDLAVPAPGSLPG